MGFIKGYRLLKLLFIAIVTSLVIAIFDNLTMANEHLTLLELNKRKIVHRLEYKLLHMQYKEKEGEWRKAYKTVYDNTNKISEQEKEIYKKKEQEIEKARSEYKIDYIDDKYVYKKEEDFKEYKAGKGGVEPGSYQISFPVLPEFREEINEEGIRGGFERYNKTKKMIEKIEISSDNTVNIVLQEGESIKISRENKSYYCKLEIKNLVRSK
ncbi:hypothetical protein FACS1894192_02810 [Bacilli bacterium]|nr:hypothetical protein FACS1894192_02810 [Bacilli bacterium]